MVNLIWIPRVLTALFIVFITLFALDSFPGNQSIWLRIAGFLIHLIPSFILLATLVLSWKYASVSGIILLVFGISMAIFFREDWDIRTFLFIALPPILAGLMFIVFGRRV